METWMKLSGCTEIGRFNNPSRGKISKVIVDVSTPVVARNWAPPMRAMALPKSDASGSGTSYSCTPVAAAG